MKIALSEESKPLLITVLDRRRRQLERRKRNILAYHTDAKVRREIDEEMQWIDQLIPEIENADPVPEK